MCLHALQIHKGVIIHSVQDECLPKAVSALVREPGFNPGLRASALDPVFANPGCTRVQPTHIRMWVESGSKLG